MKLLSFLLYPLRYLTYLIQLFIWKLRHAPKKNKPAHKPRYLLLFSTVLLLALLPLVYFVTTRPETPQAWYDTDWEYRKSITIDNTKVSGSGSHTDFPVLVSITDTDLRDYAQADGDDILFTTSSDTKLDHEIESYNSSTGVLIAWVKIPTLSTSADTVIYLYFGNDLSNNQQNAAGVWSNYEMVQHFEETTAGSTDIQDSTSNGHDSNAVKIDGTGSNPDATGQVNGAIQLDGSDDYVHIADHNNLDIGASQSFSITMWIYPESVTSHRTLIDKRSSTGTDEPGYLLRLEDGDSIMLTVSDGTTEVNVGGDSNLTANDWYHLSAVYNHDTGVASMVYLNGSPDDAANVTTATGDMSNSFDFSIGNETDTNWPFDGFFDELRFYRGVLSTDWIATEYANQNSPSTFYSIGTLESAADVLATDLVLHYRFDEGYGLSVHNSVKDLHHGTISGSSNYPWLPPDKCLINNCYNFYGDDDYIVVSDNDELDFAASDNFSYSGWFRFKNRTGDPDEIKIINKFDTSIAGGYRLYIDTSDNIVFGISDTTTFPKDSATSTGDYFDSRWHHFVAIKDGTSGIYLYLDGELAGSDTSISATGSLANSLNLAFGKNHYDDENTLEGQLDEVRLYRRKITANEISNLYARGISQLGTHSQEYLSHGLLAHWNLDEFSAGSSSVGRVDALPSSNFGNDLTDSANTPSTTGKFGRAADFDGTADYLSLADTSYLEPTSNLTVSAWVKFDDLPSVEGEDATIIHKSHSVSPWTAYELKCEDTDNTCTFIWSNSTTAQATYTNTALQANRWYHLAGVKTDTHIQVYVDGKLESSTPVSGTFLNSDGNLRIGSGDSEHFTDGQIDEVRLYNRALTPLEIEYLYSWSPGPVAHWTFDQNTGTSAYDYSTNNFTATLGTSTATPSWVSGKFNSALSFDGGDHATVANDDKLVLGNQDFTVSAWVIDRNDDASYYTWLAKGETASGEWIFYHSQTNKLRFYAHSGAIDMNYTTTFSDGNWHHIAVIRQGTTATMYLDGVAVATDTSATADLTSTKILSIGASEEGANRKTVGSMDDVKIYNYALPVEKLVTDVVNPPLPANLALDSPLSHWKFDELSGDTAYDTLGLNDGDLAGSGTTCPGNSTCPAWNSSGRVNGSTTYDGNDSIDLGNPSSLQFERTDPFSISTWIKTTSENNYSLFSKQESSGNYAGYNLQTGSSGYIYFQLINTYSSNGLEVRTGDTNYNDGNWHHVLVTYDGNSSASGVQIYFDGTPQQLTTLQNNLSLSVANSTSAHIGSRNNAENFLTGTLDEVKVYPFALTPSQAALDYNMGVAVNLGTGHNQSDLVSSGAGDPPIVYFPLDENQGTSSVKDRSGSGLSATMTSLSESSWVPGKYGSALYLDGDADYISVADQGASDPLRLGGATSFTITAWVKISDLSASSEHFVVSKYNYASSEGYALSILSDGKVALKINGISNTYTTTLTPITENKWHHIAGLFYGGNSLYFYVDGKFSGAASFASTSITESDDAFSIGSASDALGNTNYVLAGNIDEVKLFDYALNPSRLSYEYNQGAPNAHWKFDECQGTTANDATGNGYSLTIAPGSGTAPDNDAAGTCDSGNTDEMWNDGTEGKINASLGFDGSDDYAYSANTTILAPHNHAILTGSWGGWIRPSSSAASKTIIHKNNEFRLTTNASSQPNCSIYYSGSFSSGVTATTALPLNTWSHVMCVYNGVNLKLVINNQLNNQVSETNYITSNSSTALNIGRDSAGSGYFNGKLDEIQIYNYTPSLDQIKQIYNDNSAVRFE